MPNKKPSLIQLPTYSKDHRPSKTIRRAMSVQFRGVPLPEALDQIHEQLLAYPASLNEAWAKLNKDVDSNPANRPLIGQFLTVAAWAYALSVELSPHTEACQDGPTNPLSHMFIGPLEQIFTNCFAAAHMFGTKDESMVGLRGLLTDFHTNGGIELRTGTKGPGFERSFRLYFEAYFCTIERHPNAYNCFGELLREIGSLVSEKYPRVAPRLMGHIDSLVSQQIGGFATPGITSPAKTAMLKVLARTKGLLSRVEYLDETG
jgi:hypothetical protein